jgi:cytochrome o ubiquinol oxidase operon protein cyoD
MSMQQTYFEDIGAWPRSGRLLYAYVAGFVFSLALTLAMYELAIHAMLTPKVLLSLAAFALLQFVVQVAFFLHLGTEHTSRDRLAIFGIAVAVALTLVVGSLWIMFNLAGRMVPDMNSLQVQQYLHDQNGGI